MSSPTNPPSDPSESEKFRPDRFRKKPVVIEAMRFPKHQSEIRVERILAWGSGQIIAQMDGQRPARLYIETLEGRMTAMPGDWIVKGIAGEFYPCKNEIFEATYERI